jgi:hypothetical protein
LYRGFFKDLRAGDAAEQAIRTQNQAVGIGLNAQTADPQRVSDRIDGIVTSVSMQADADSALDALERESVGFTASAADEALEASGSFLASVGRSAKIVRTASANACAWCLEREGTYEYPGVPKDVFQRHANCTCTLDYYPAERSDKQNAWTKEWAEQVGREVRESPTLENQPTFSEQSRPVNIGTPQADLTYINSTSYRSKFNSISDNPALNQAIYKYAKAAVIHQSGDYYEDLSILTVDGDLVKQTSGKIPNQTNTTDILPYISQYPPYTLLSIHNHGTNLPPSGADFASAGEKKYAFGIVACNNGKLYYYSTAKARPFLSKLFDDTVDKYCSPPYNMSTSNAYAKALKELEKYGVEWRELK